ncbi:hypothetical protein GJAV_G00195140 [Gymnothorax javanicus]|nr:hypothetical protein GJAV_G00195140 [Gymnothorax javanicus]
MAAVAAEPGASAALTTTAGDRAELDPEIQHPVTAEAKREAEATKEFSPVMDLVHLPKNGDAAQGCDLMLADSRCAPDSVTAGNALFNFVESDHLLVAANREGSEPTDHELESGAAGDLGCTADNMITGMPPAVNSESGIYSCDSPTNFGSDLTSDSAAAAAAFHNCESDTKNMLAETELAVPLAASDVPAVPVAEHAYSFEPELVQQTVFESEKIVFCAQSAETGTELESGLPSDAAALRGDIEPEPEEDVVPKFPGSVLHSAADVTPPVVVNGNFPTLMSTGDEVVSVDSTEVPSVTDTAPAVSEPVGLLAQDGMFGNEPESEPKPSVTGENDGGLCPKSIAQLIPGSEVRVALDHVIDDALVVSFRLGERIFSGVLMDLSKRFGPYGIPVTVYPKREYREMPKSMQLKTELESLPSETEKQGSQDVPVAPTNELTQPPSASSPAPSQWPAKPPPLFQEGAPYPPPLFIRDTYSQSIPQPPPRKIKRPKRKLYREEPTSIMNAIKLRPRQVLCDKCKGVVSAPDKREVRRAPASDCRGDEAKRRRNESAATVAKRPRPEEKGRAVSDGARRPTPVVRLTALSQAKVAAVGNSAMKVAAVAGSSPATSTSRVQPHTKKVLQNKNVDHSKTGETLKRRQRDRDRASGKDKIGCRAPSTRASRPRDAHQKVHFTRRRHQVSGGGRVHANPLPPRIRLKPQRYRNEENDSSTLKPATGFDRGQEAAAGLCPSWPHLAALPRAPSPRPPLGNPPMPPTMWELRNTSLDPKPNPRPCLILSQRPRRTPCQINRKDQWWRCPLEKIPRRNMGPKLEEKKPNKSVKAGVFSKNVSKCVTTDGRTICVGDIVWAKIYGFPWWPARILLITVSRKDNGLLARQEARISWFGSPTTSFLALSQVTPFLENFQLRFDKKRKGLYRKAITEAAKAAKQLTPEVRALLTQFET